MRSPWSTYVSLFIIFTLAQALRLPFRKWTITGASVSSPFKTSFSFSALSQSQPTVTQDVNDVQDIRYVTNITINGVQVTVALDTGSTDLWVIPPGGIGTFNDTRIALSLLYGDGSYGTSGTIGVAPFEFGSYKVEQQAFLNAVQSTIGGIQDIGIHGLMGLGFNLATSSPIGEKIQSIYGPDATWGRSVLENIFMQNPSEPNMVALLLARTGDSEDTDGGSFTIGEYLPQYASVVNQAKLPQFPRGGGRWTVLMDGVYVDGTALDLASDNSGVPFGQAQTLLDTGNPSVQVPTALYDAIYSRIPGSALYNGDSGRMWIVPCNSTTNLEFSFAGVHYPIHPLDLSIISSPFTVNGQQYIACVAAFQAADGLSSSGYDVALGDSFLRNVYSIFNFGGSALDGSTSNAYIQLLSTVSPVKAISEVASIRGQTLAGLPPEIAPATMVGLLTSADSNTGAATLIHSSPAAPFQTSSSSLSSLNSEDTEPKPDAMKPKPDVVKPEPDDTKPEPKPSATKPTPHASAKPKPDITKPEPDDAKPEPDTKPEPDDTRPKSDSLSVGGAGGGTIVDKYGAVIVSLSAANLFVGFILLAFGVLSYIRRGSSSKTNIGRKITVHSVGPPLYVPVKAIDPDEDHGFSQANLNRYDS